MLPGCVVTDKQTPCLPTSQCRSWLYVRCVVWLSDLWASEDRSERPSLIPHQLISHQPPPQTLQFMPMFVSLTLFPWFFCSRLMIHNFICKFNAALIFSARSWEIRMPANYMRRDWKAGQSPRACTKYTIKQTPPNKINPPTQVYTYTDASTRKQTQSHSNTDTNMHKTLQLWNSINKH